MSYKMLVCGSRTFDDYWFMRSELDRIVSKRGKPDVVINGGMSGADALSSYWAYQQSIDTECHGARWGTDGRKAAGPMRNARMAERLGIGDVVVAFIDKPLSESRGTQNMVTRAKAANATVYVRSPL